MGCDIKKSATAEELLNSHSITKQLRAFGLTDAQLAGLRFRNTRPENEFNLWPFQWLEGTPLKAAHLFKAYCALKWLLLENPPHSESKESAWAYIALTEAAPLSQIGRDTKAAQSKRAQNPRGKIPGEGKTVNKLIEELALNPEYLDESAKELWSHFFAELDELGLEPEEHEALDLKKCSCKYSIEGSPRNITLGRFSNIVSTTRKKKTR